MKYAHARINGSVLLVCTFISATTIQLLHTLNHVIIYTHLTTLKFTIFVHSTGGVLAMGDCFYM